MVRRIHDEPSIRRFSIAPARRVAIGPVARSAALSGAVAVLLIGALAWPLVFASSYFTGDWLTQLWLMWHQSLALQANHLPSLFLTYKYGVLYPHYAFYGATLYALTGGLSLLLGDAPVETYVLTYLLGFAAAYGGWYWIARTARLGLWWAHVPGLVFIASAYYLTLIYARGDWPEFIGVSTIPLMVAAGLSVLRADRMRFWPAAALTISSTLFFGSHSLTIVWGSTMLIVLGVAIVLCIPQARREVTRRGAIRVVGLVLPSLLLSSWFLLPAVAYESTTRIASEYQVWQLALRETMGLVSARHLFTLSRASASAPGDGFALSLPILFMAWALVSVAVFLRTSSRRPWTRVLLICAIFTAAMTVLMTHAGLILALPRYYATLQFSYRLESYVLLGLSGTILAALVLAKSGGRRLRLWSWLLLPILIVSVVGAMQQAAAYNRSSGDRYAELNRVYTYPGSGEELEDYLDVHLPILAEGAVPRPTVLFPPAAVHDNRVSAVAADVHPGELVDSNLQGPPTLVHVAGAKIVGLSPPGYDVLEIAPAPRRAAPSTLAAGSSPPTTTISVSPADSLPVVLGRVLTLCALIALVAQFAALAVRRRRAV
jgi:hypothetical protein